MPELETIELGSGSFWYICDIDCVHHSHRLVVMAK